MPQDIENSKFRIRIKKLEDKTSNISSTGLSASFTYLTGTYFSSSQLTASNILTNTTKYNNGPSIYGSSGQLIVAGNISAGNISAGDISAGGFDFNNNGIGTIQTDTSTNEIYLRAKTQLNILKVDSGDSFVGLSIYDDNIGEHILSCINDSGHPKVGILNTSPTYTFDVVGTARTTDSMFVDNNLTVTNNLIVNGNTTLGNASGDILRITGSANFNNNIVLSSTSGIVFGAIGGSVVTSVTLNDYEEGNWTPRFLQTGGGGSYFYQRQQGKYIKIGKLCTVTADLRLTSSLPATNGNIVIEGLPYTCANAIGYYSQASSGYYQDFKSTITDFPSGYVEINNTFINLTYPAAGSNRWMTNADLLANGTNYSAIIITVSYITV